MGMTKQSMKMAWLKSKQKATPKIHSAGPKDFDVMAFLSSLEADENEATPAQVFAVPQTNFLNPIFT
jgi:hypothetical protein